MARASLRADRAKLAPMRLTAYDSVLRLQDPFPSMRHLAVTTAVAIVCLIGPGAHAAPLAAHRAVYGLALDTSKSQEVVAAHGTMTFDVQDACTGWATSQHLVIELTNKDGQDVHMVSDYATLESKDGTHLDFHTRQVTDTATTEQLDGTATLERAGGRGHADFTSPEKTQVLLPVGTLLPMAHTAALLDAAQTGKKFLSVPLFDGTGADGAQDTFVTVENWAIKAQPGKQAGSASSPAPAPGAAWTALAALPSGRVEIAFFDRTRATETPSYEIGMTYFSNGVADGLAMNFGDFQMSGRLQQLDVHKPPHC